MSEITDVRRPRSPAPTAAPENPLEDDDLLWEILLRLPPQPSSLPRASLVSKRWCRHVSDPRFRRRFRAHHGRSPALLGFFTADTGFPSFTPTLEAPDRVPAERFSLQLDESAQWRFLGCRHGLALMLNRRRRQILVWNPVTGDQIRLAVPQGFEDRACTSIHHGAVLRPAEDARSNRSPFQVVLVGHDMQCTRAYLYSSETGIWGNLISAPLPMPSLLPIGTVPSAYVSSTIPSVMVGDSLYWLLAGCSPGIIEFNLDTKSLAIITAPVSMYADRRFWVMPAEGGGLGFLYLSGFSAQFWERKADSNGVSSWVLAKTIELDKLFALHSEDDRVPLRITAFAEDNNVVFVWTAVGVFMLHIGSMRFKKVFKTTYYSVYHPFATVCTPGGQDGAAERLVEQGNSIIDGHDVAEDYLVELAI